MDIWDVLRMYSPNSFEEEEEENYEVEGLNIEEM